MEAGALGGALGAPELQVPSSSLYRAQAPAGPAGPQYLGRGKEIWAALFL